MEKAEKAQVEKGWENTNWFAKFFDLSEERIRQLADMGILRKKKVKGVYYYETIPSIRSYIKYLQDNAANAKRTSQDKENEKLDADIAFKRAKAKLTELELEQLTLTLLRAKDVQAFVEDLGATIKSALTSLPGKLAMDVHTLSEPAEIAEVITTEINNILDILASYEFNIEFYRKRIKDDDDSNIAIDEEDIE